MTSRMVWVRPKSSRSTSSHRAIPASPSHSSCTVPSPCDPTPFPPYIPASLNLSLLITDLSFGDPEAPNCVGHTSPARSSNAACARVYTAPSSSASPLAIASTAAAAVFALNSPRSSCNLWYFCMLSWLGYAACRSRKMATVSLLASKSASTKWNPCPPTSSMGVTSKSSPSNASNESLPGPNAQA